MKTLDIIIPVYNEEAVLSYLFKELDKIFNDENLSDANIKKVNYIYIDDGSSDRSASLIKGFLEDGRDGQLIRFTRNFGHQNAVAAGIDHSSSDLVSIIDADLQDPPMVILEMVKKIAEGNDVVYGVRKRRKEGFFKVFCYWLYYRILSYFSELSIALDSGDFFVMNRVVADTIKRLPEKIRYTRGLKTWIGYKQVGYEYERHSRKAGKTKYPFSRLYDLATNGVTSLSIKPLRVTQLFSFLFSILSVALSSFIVFLLFAKSNNQNVYFYITYLFISIIGTFIMMCLYVLSAYIGRTYIEVKGRPTYIMLEKLKWDCDDE